MVEVRLAANRAGNQQHLLRAGQPVERGQQVQPAVAEGGVETGAAQIERAGGDGLLLKGEAQAGNGAQEQGNPPGDLGGSARGAGAGGVQAVGGCGIQRHARRHQRRIGIVDVARAWAARAKGGDGAVVVDGAHGESPGVVGRADVGGDVGPGVAGGEHRHDAGRHQRQQVGLEGHVTHAARGVAPRVIDHVGGAGVGRVVVGVERPLQGQVNRSVGVMGGVIENLGGDPFGARGDADGGAAGAVANHQAHGLRAVAVEVGGGEVLGVGVVPRVRPAAVAGCQVGVSEVDAGIQAGDDHALPGVAHAPQRRGVDQRHVGLGGGGRCCGLLRGGPG